MAQIDLRHAQLTKPAPLRVVALLWFPKTGSISIFDLLGMNESFQFFCCQIMRFDFIVLVDMKN